MTEAEWLGCVQATQAVMNWLRPRGSDRKFYLVSAAVLRLIWDQLPDERFRELVSLIERHADGRCSGRELGRHQAAAENDAMARYLSQAGLGRMTSQARKGQAAAAAAAHAAMPGNGWHSACNAIHEAVAAGEQEPMRASMAAILRDIFGNPFQPVQLNRAWRTRAVLGLAEGIYADRAFDRLPMLADALEDAGSANAAILSHCRQPGEHVLGCWAVDLILSKDR